MTLMGLVALVVVMSVIAETVKVSRVFLAGNVRKLNSKPE